MKVTIELTEEEIDALQMAISDAEYWARQMRGSDNLKDGYLYSERALVLKGILGKSSYAD